MPTDRWTSGADYELWMGRWSRLVAAEFLDWLELPAGLRWIDICCGSGVLSATISEKNQPLSIAGIDASAAQINFARERRGAANVSFDVGDAMALPFRESMFDVAVCGLGLNFVPDPLRALREFQRVVEPGGTVAIYVWDYEQGARFLREFWDAAAEIDREAFNFDQARRFPLCTEPALRDLFKGAGFAGLSTHSLEIVTRFLNFDDYWEPLLTGQGSAPNYLASRSPETRAKIRQRLQATLPVGRDEAIELPARAWAVRGRKP
jgi:SAM-dependent methyltransferase